MQFISKYVGIGLWVAQVQGMDLLVELLDNAADACLMAVK